MTNKLKPSDAFYEEMPREKKMNGWYKDKFGRVHIKEYSLEEFIKKLK